MLGFEIVMIWIETFCRRRAWLCLALFSVVYFTGEGLRASRRPFWFDELATFYLARVGAPAMWETMGRVGETNHPPLAFWLTAISQQVFGATEFGTRAPMLAAFWVACLALYLIVRRHFEPAWGFAAVLLLFFSGAEYYATEARAYSIVLGAGAIVFYCWQSAPERRSGWTILLLGISTATAICSHYLAVLFLVPLGCGEVVRTFRRQKIDWPVWFAWTLGVAPLAVFLPRMVVARNIYAAHNTTPATLENVGKSYVLLFETLLPVLLFVIVGLVVWAASPTTADDNAARPIPREEFVAAIGIVLLPFIAWAAGPFTNALHARYVIGAVMGVIPLFIFMCGSYLGHRKASGAVCFSLTLAIFLCVQGSRAVAFIARRGAVLGQQTVTAASVPEDLAIVVDSPLSYFPLAHYAEPLMRPRLHFIDSPADAASTTGSDTMDVYLLRFQQITPFKVDNYPGLLGQHGARFLLYVNRVYPNGWIMDKAVSMGGRVTYLRKLDDETTIYLVAMP